MSSLAGYAFESSVHPLLSSSTVHEPVSVHPFSIPTVVKTSDQPLVTHISHQVPHCQYFSAFDSTNTVASVGASQASPVFKAPSKYTPSVDGSPPIQEAFSTLLVLPNETADSFSLDQLSSLTQSTHLEPSLASTPNPKPMISFNDSFPISFAFHEPSSSAPKTGPKNKKPLNSFMLYRRAKAKQNLAKYKLKNYSSKQISIIVGKLWEKEPENVKWFYKAQADREKLRYDQEGSIPSFSYRPAGTSSLLSLTASPSLTAATSSSASRAASSSSEPAPISSSSSFTESQAANASLFINSTSSSLPPLPRMTMAMPLMFTEWRQPQSLESNVSSPSSSATAASPISATGQSLKFERSRFERSGGGVIKSRAQVSGQKLVHRPKKTTTGVTSGAANPGQSFPPPQQQQEHQTGTKAKTQRSEQEQKPISDHLRYQEASSTRERHHSQEQNNHDTVMTSPLLSRPLVQQGEASIASLAFAGPTTSSRMSVAMEDCPDAAT